MYSNISVCGFPTSRPAAILFVCAVFIGIIFSPFIFPIYWDEIEQNLIGEYNFNQYVTVFDRIFGTSFSNPAYADFEHFRDRDYGSIFEVLTVVLGKIAAKFFVTFDFADFIVIKHFAVFFVFILGTCGVYSIAERRLCSSLGGLLAAVVFFLSPRLFGNAFFNSKDIVFLSFFVLSINYILLSSEKCSARSVVLAALFTAIASSARIIGLFSLFLGVFVFLISWYRNGWSGKMIFSVIVGFVLLTLLLIYCFYPFLWPSPFSRAYDVISAMSKFTRHADVSLLAGKSVNSHQEPFYLLHWMAITLPFQFIFLALVGQLQGLLLMLKGTFHLSLWKDREELVDYIITGLGLCPVLVSFIKHPWVYDGWRHFYFLVPFLSVSVAVAVFKLASLFGNRKTKIVVAVWLSATVILESLIGILRFFPYPNCYFNSYAGHNLINSYDLDYSGTAGHEGLVRIISLHKDLTKPIVIYSDRIALFRERLGLAGKMIRVVYKDKEKFPDYVVSNRQYLTRTEHDLYHEVSSVETLGGEVLLRILVPNNNRDSFCKLNKDKCDIRR